MAGKEINGSHADKILETVFVYYPLHCQNLHCADLKKLDELIAKVKTAECDEVRLRKAVTKLVSFLNAVQLSSEKNREEPLVDGMINYLQDNFAEEIDINAFAEQKSVSVYYLCHLFKKKTGLTIYGYRNACRFAQAKRMLTDSEMKISEICQQCGFGDLSYFTRKFKEAENITPTMYRELHRCGKQC